MAEHLPPRLRVSRWLPRVLAHKRLVELIDERSVNAVSLCKEDKGSSLLFWLLVRPEGRAVIRAYPHLLRDINFGTCFKEVESGEYVVNRLLLY